MLPLVGRIALDLQQGWQRWRDAVEHYELVAAGDGSDTDGAREALAAVEQRAADVEALRRELRPLGASCPSPRTARIEWTTEIAGVAGRLVWYPGDGEVRHWIAGDEPASAIRVIPGMERPEDDALADGIADG
jgi:hypothetical protein